MVPSGRQLVMGWREIEVVVEGSVVSVVVFVVLFLKDREKWRWLSKMDFQSVLTARVLHKEEISK